MTLTQSWSPVFCLTWLGVVPELNVAVHLRSFGQPTLPSLHFSSVLVGTSKYSTEWFSVTVPGGDRSQGCHGYFLC